MIPPELSTALDLYKAGSTSVDGFWNIFNVVTLAVVGFVFGGKIVLPGQGKLAIAVAFLSFAVSNNLALGKAQRLRVAAKAVVQKSIEDAGPDSSAAYVAMLRTVDASPAEWMQGFQAVLSIALLVAIWA